VEVKDGAGKRLFYDLMVPGDEKALEGVPPFDVLLGYAPGVTVEYNGKRVDHSIYTHQDMARFRVGDKGTSKQ
jgi:cytoskeleton protein RodZ